MSAQLLQDQPFDPKLGELITNVSNAGFACGEFDFDEDTDLDAYGVLLNKSNAADEELRQYVNALVAENARLLEALDKSTKALIDATGETVVYASGKVMAKAA